LKRRYKITGGAADAGLGGVGIVAIAVARGLPNSSWRRTKMLSSG